MKKRLLYVHNADFSSSGANKLQVLNMCEAFSKVKLEVSLLSFGNSGKENSYYNFNSKINYIFLKIFRSWNYYFRTLILFFNFIKISNNYDYVFSRDLFFSFLVSLFFRKKVIYELHDFPESGLWRWLFRKTFNHLHYLIVISNGLHEILIANRYDDEKIILLHDGVNLNNFSLKISKLDARRELNLDKGWKKIVSYIGSTGTERDLELLIKAAGKLKEVHFLVYGPDNDYLLKASVKNPNFHYMGFTKTPAIVYKASDILFGGYTKKIKTINYMSPLKIFEYMASKRPIIVADFPRIRDILDDDECFYYQSGNVEDFISKVEIILNKEKYSFNISKKAYLKVKGNYTWKIRATKINELFKNG